MPRKASWSAFPLSLLLLGMQVSGAMAASPAVEGQWRTVPAPNSTQPLLVPINPVHAALLPNGKVLVVAGSGNCPPTQSGCPTGPSSYGFSSNSGAALYDPAAKTFTQLRYSSTVSYDMFCNSMVLLPNGTALIAGGTLQYDPFEGAANTSTFDPSANSFTIVQNMAQGRGIRQ